MAAARTTVALVAAAAAAVGSLLLMGVVVFFSPDLGPRDGHELSLEEDYDVPDFGSERREKREIAVSHETDDEYFYDFRKYLPGGYAFGEHQGTMPKAGKVAKAGKNKKMGLDGISKSQKRAKTPKGVKRGKRPKKLQTFVGSGVGNRKGKEGFKKPTAEVTKKREEGAVAFPFRE